jgi:hypothetical protein
MHDMPSQLTSWRTELERELLALEQQINDLRSNAADLLPQNRRHRPPPRRPPRTRNRDYIRRRHQCHR